jgi:hypothetical protein
MTVRLCQPYAQAAFPRKILATFYFQCKRKEIDYFCTRRPTFAMRKQNGIPNKFSSDHVIIVLALSGLCAAAQSACWGRSFCPTVDMKQLEIRWRDFNEIWYTKTCTRLCKHFERNLLDVYQGETCLEHTSYRNEAHVLRQIHFLHESCSFKGTVNTRFNELMGWGGGIRYCRMSVKSKCPYSSHVRRCSSLSCDRSVATSKLSSPKSAILSFLLQLPVTSCFLHVIQPLLTSPSSPSCPYNLSFNDVS